MKKLSLKKIALCCLGIYVCFILASQQFTLARQKKEIEKQTSLLEKAEEKNQRLIDEIKLSNDDSYIEKLAREKLGLVKSGETTVIDSK